MRSRRRCRDRGCRQGRQHGDGRGIVPTHPEHRSLKGDRGGLGIAGAGCDVDRRQPDREGAAGIRRGLQGALGHGQPDRGKRTVDRGSDEPEGQPAGRAVGHFRLGPEHEHRQPLAQGFGRDPRDGHHDRCGAFRRRRFEPVQGRRQQPALGGAIAGPPGMARCQRRHVVGQLRVQETGGLGTADLQPPVIRQRAQGAAGRQGSKVEPRSRRVGHVLGALRGVEQLAGCAGDPRVPGREIQRGRGHRACDRARWDRRAGTRAGRARRQG